LVLILDLVDRPAIRLRPRAPLLAVDGAELAVLVGPLVPDRHAVLLEGAHIRVAGDEPEQFVDDRFQMHLLGGEKRKPLLEVEPHLIAEDAARSGAGAVAPVDAMVEDVLEKVQILAIDVIVGNIQSVQHRRLHIDRSRQYPMHLVPNGHEMPSPRYPRNPAQ
jgi:hypothetical protein